MKNLLLAGAVVLFGGVAATGAAAVEHKSTKHAAPARASVMSMPSFHQDATPKKHHASKKHHGRVHHRHHSK